jgi:hypothetical protein
MSPEGADSTPHYRQPALAVPVCLIVTSYCVDGSDPDIDWPGTLASRASPSVKLRCYSGHTATLHALKTLQ